MRETFKAKERRALVGYFRTFLCGDGIDVGCGHDVLEVEHGTVVPYDLKVDASCDAQTMAGIAAAGLDFLYSSNCLEHLPDPGAALLNWIRVVKPGGFVFFTVPDEDLYEQGHWPSRFNHRHLWSFTTKTGSSMPKSICLPTWLGKFPADILSIEVVDTNYDHSLVDVDQTLKAAEAFIEVILRRHR